MPELSRNHISRGGGGVIHRQTSFFLGPVDSKVGQRVLTVCAATEGQNHTVSWVLILLNLSAKSAAHFGLPFTSEKKFKKWGDPGLTVDHLHREMPYET